MSTKKIPDPQDPTKQVDGTVVKVVDAKEPFSFLTLEDGTEVTLRNTVVEVVRVLERWDGQGQPVYSVTSQGTITVTAPEDLRKPSC